LILVTAVAVHLPAITVDLSASLSDLGAQPEDDIKHTAQGNQPSTEHKSIAAEESKGTSHHM
jgi:hypothetical protein